MFLHPLFLDRHMRKFFVFEGIDGVGKTTISKIVKKSLESKGHRVTWCCDPMHGPLREYIKGNASNLNWLSQTHLFCASRNILIESIIKPALKDQQYVLCDRFWPSTIAYQGVTGNKRTIHALCTYGILNFQPSIYFWLNGPTRRTELTDALEHIDRGAILYNYRTMAVYTGHNAWINIDADRPTETISNDIESLILNKY